MTYLLNNSELCTLLKLSSSVPTPLSPLYGCSDMNNENYAVLERSGFIKTTDQGTVVDGVLMRILATLSSPDVCLKLERTSVSSDACLCSNDGNVWYVYSYIGYLDAHMIGEFSSPDEVCDWFFGEYAPDCIPSEGEAASGAFSLSYDEWNLFMLTQFIFMRKAHGNAENDDVLAFSELASSKFGEFLQGELVKRGFPVYASLFESLSDEDFLKELCESLYQKDIFDVHENGGDENDGGDIAENGDVYIGYTDAARDILDCRGLLECIKISRSDINGTAYKTLISSRKNGYTVLADDGHDIRVVAVKSIPFKTYLKV